MCHRWFRIFRSDSTIKSHTQKPKQSPTFIVSTSYPKVFRTRKSQLSYSRTWVKEHFEIYHRYKIWQLNASDNVNILHPRKIFFYVYFESRSENSCILATFLFYIELQQFSTSFNIGFWETSSYIRGGGECW